MFNYFYKLGAAKALKEFAPGIPTARNIDLLPTVGKPQTWTLAIQRHLADRAGEHLDLRLIDPATGKAHSWALPKARLPEPGQSVLAVQQPTHTEDYARNFGLRKPQKITSGYGKGTVSIEHLSDADVFHSKPETEGTRVRFNIYKGTHPEEYAIVRTSSGADLLVNKTLNRARLSHLPLGSKPKLREKAHTALDVNDTSEIMMPKLDGAHTLIDLAATGKIPRLFSYRLGQRAATGVIEHTHKAPSLLEQKVPKGLAGTILRAETIGVDRETGKAIAAKDLAGLLNSNVNLSRQKQKELGIEIKPVVFDIDKYRGRDVSNKSFTERHNLIREIASQMKLDFVELARTAKEKSQLLDTIKAKKHSLTSEGVILRSDVVDHATKVKFRPDYDVHVRSIFGIAGKNRAGGFEYSITPKGKPVGRVGTGFSHAEAKEMLDDPSKYVGRVAKIEAETQYPSGSLAKPSFKEWHLEKGKL